MKGDEMKTLPPAIPQYCNNSESAIRTLRTDTKTVSARHTAFCNPGLRRLSVLTAVMAVAIQQKIMCLSYVSSTTRMQSES
ncbi:hypothetical protein AB833_09065 [Chromatiales bacterium (ex Bugula neritina AB1)]|nr:hypothetical protein AB833_09065 [Chromatiales bacterium (ex Bugula neritina AB1)]